MESRNRLIVIEAQFDVCGKTTVSQELVKLLGAALVKSPESPVAQFRKTYDECGDFTARFLYYASATVLLSNHIRELLHTTDVVCDRYIASTVFYHQALGVDTSMLDVGKLGLVLPDITFCLTCNEEVWRERFAARGEIKEDHIEDTPGLRHKVEKLMKENIPHHIDTSYTTPLEAAKQVALAIG